MATVLTRPAERAPKPRVSIVNAGAGWRPRNPGRVAAGVLVVALSMLVALIAFRTAGHRVAVLVVARDVPAGAQITDRDLSVVNVATDGSLQTISANGRSVAVGEYAKVRLLQGSLLVDGALQPRPLVDSNAAVLAIQVAPGALPIGLREQSRVWLVLSPTSGAATAIVPATVVSLPDDLATGAVSLSIQVSFADAPRVATAAKVTVLLIDPRTTAAPPDLTAAQSTP
jgi:hypothetical protein